MKYGQTKNFGKNIPKVNICKLFGPAETNWQTENRFYNAGNVRKLRIPDSLVLFAYNRNKGNTEKEWQKILEDLIAPTLAEKGALHYELHVSKDDPKDFMFHETWQTVEDWNAHMAAPHLISLVGILDRYTENGITVIKTKPID